MAQPLNALIPMGVNVADFGGSVGKGLDIGNSLLDAPRNRRLLDAKTKQLEAEANALNEFGMSPLQAEQLAIDRRRLELAEQESTRGPDPTASYQDYERASADPGYAAFLANKRPMTEAQGKTSTYADRLGESHKIITDQEGVISDNPLQAGAYEIFGDNANMFLGADMQQTLQAQRNFVNSVLRRESGAVISPSEFDNARKQYFPQIGDTPEVIAQKRQNRLTVLQGMSREAGPQYEGPELYNPQGGEPAQPAAAAASGGAPQYNLPPGMTFEQIKSWVQEAKAAGKTDEQIRAKMIELGIDPDQ